MITIKQTVALTGNVAFGNSISLKGAVTGNAISKINMDYNPLINHPHINGYELIGNKTSEELGLESTIVDITEQDIDNIIYGG